MMETLNNIPVLYLSLIIIFTVAACYIILKVVLPFFVAILYMLSPILLGLLMLACLVGFVVGLIYFIITLIFY